MKVVLMRKLADCIDGVDISRYERGDVMDVPPPEARLLMAEQWAIAERRHEHRPPPDEERRGQSGPGRTHDRLQRAS